MSDHNRYCLLSNMFYSFEESEGQRVIDNEVMDNEVMDNEVMDNEVMNNGTDKSTNELLIDCVRSYPHLYNHQNKNFKNNLMKENSWKEIASVMKMSVSECQVQWTGLRDKFVREKRQMELETRSGSGASRRTTFALYETMLFLGKHIKRRQSYTNVSKSSKCPKLAFDIERNSIFESESPIYVLNENS